MAVVIRMRRAGAKKKAFYHVVAADKRSPRDGKYIEKLGFYDPAMDPPVFELNRERLQHWLSKGAKTSQTVAQLVAKHGNHGTAEQSEKSSDA